MCVEHHIENYSSNICTAKCCFCLFASLFFFVLAVKIHVLHFFFFNSTRSVYYSAISEASKFISLSETNALKKKKVIMLKAKRKSQQSHIPPARKICRKNVCGIRFFLFSFVHWSWHSAHGEWRTSVK